MLHKSREYSIAVVDAPDTLAEKLTQHTWCPCNGFMLEYANRQLFYLNDSTSPDGAQEYTVLLGLGGGQFEQVESVTFGWMDEDEARKTIRLLHQGTLEKYGRANPTMLPAKEHGTCHLCR